MNRNRNTLLALLAITGLLLLASCPAQPDSGSNSAIAEDDHSGEGHAPHAEPAAAEDDHSGHDHAAHAEPATAEDDPHAGHDHSAHAGEDEVTGITLSLAQISELGISSMPAGPGSLAREIELSGEIGINEDEITHVIPSTSGIVRRVNYRLGDKVARGAVMLELDSIELASIKSSYLAVLSQLELLKQNMEREQMLVDKGISAEQDYLEARQAHEEKLIEKRGLEQQLRALGVSEAQIAKVVDNPDAPMTNYIVTAPATGEIIEKHVAVGEMIDNATPLFTISDLSTVWVRLNVHQQDMLDISEGLEVVIDAGHGVETASGVIDYIEPLIGEETRTAVARVVLQRSSEVFRPGLFVTGHVEVGGEMVDILVPRDSVIELDEDKLIFVRHGTTFEPRVVLIGQRSAVSTEVLSGLEAGEEIVVSGAFQLKAELLKGTFDPHAGHAH